MCIRDSIHIAQSNIRLAKIIDEVAGGFYVTGILGDSPAIVPDVAAFAGNYICLLYTSRYKLIHHARRCRALLLQHVWKRGDRVSSVSYTHLDVYKRQGTEGVGTFQGGDDTFQFRQLVGGTDGFIIINSKYDRCV